MRCPDASLAAPCAVLAIAGLLWAGCGSGRTETVSVASGNTARSTQTQTVTGKTTARPNAPAPSHGQGSQTSHTAPAPAFTRTSPSSSAAEGQLADAIATVKAHGYAVNDASTYQREHTLGVLVGSRAGATGGKQAFFFLNGRYIGTDASEPSGNVKVVGQGDTEVTLAYSLYRRGDPSCCPSGGQAEVRFQLDNGRLSAVDPIPPVSSPSGFGRQ